MLKMPIPWLEKLSKRIHKTMKPIPTIPEFLNSEEKSYKIVKETDTVEKFENILYTILDDDNISTLDTFKIMKQLEADIIKQHRNEDIRTILDVVAGISKYIYVTLKEMELKYERGEISHYLTEKQKELIKEEEELVKYIIQSDEEDY